MFIAGIIKQEFKITFIFVGINDDAVFPHLIQLKGLMFVDLDIGIKKIEKKGNDRTQMSRQKAGMMIMGILEKRADALRDHHIEPFEK